MLINFSIPKSGSTFIHLVLSRYLESAGYISRERLADRIAVPDDLNNHINLKTRHIPFLEACLERDVPIVARTHSLAVLTAAMNAGCKLTFSHRDPLQSVESAFAHLTRQRKKAPRERLIDQLRRPLRAVNFISPYVGHTDILLAIKPECRIRYDDLLADNLTALRSALEGNGYSVDQGVLQTAISAFSATDRETMLATKSYRRGNMTRDSLSRLERAYAARRVAPLARALGYPPYSVGVSSWLMSPSTIIARRAAVSIARRAAVSLSKTLRPVSQ